MSVQPKDHRCPCGVYDEHCPHCVHRDELIEDMKQAECGKCGRSLAPDGDCFGCEADRLTADNAALRELLNRAAYIMEYQSRPREKRRMLMTDSEAFDQIIQDIRAALDAAKEE